jgi:diguanylate cyclase (GGDEF)-like protein/PAS domain S-box-containing protein
MKDDSRSGTRMGPGEPMDRAKEACETTSGSEMNVGLPDQILPESYRSCLDAIPDLMALKGEELEYLFVNKAFCETTAKRQDEVIGKRATEIFEKNIARKLETMDLLVLASLEGSTEEVVLDSRIYEVRKFPVNLHDRGLVVATMRDITERKESEANLLTEKIRFQIISDNAPLAMILLDAQGTVKYLNARFREVFGFEQDDVPEGETWFRKSFPGTEYEVLVATVISRPDEVAGWKGRERHVMTCVRRDGTRRMVSFEAVQLVSGDVVISCDDLSERRADESALLIEADFDTLTGLPGRSSLGRATGLVLDRAREGKKRRALSALLFLGIHGFDQMKRTYGTGPCGEILVTFSRLLTSILRAGDVAYRSGEDQFAVVFKGISLAEAKLAAERIRQSLTAFTFLAGSGDLRLGIAVALVQVDGVQEAADLLKTGETMIEEAKAPDLSRILVYDAAREERRGS